MPTLEQEFQAYLDTERLKTEFAESEAYKRYQAEIAQGGSIRQASPEAFRNPPIGAVAGGIAGAVAGGPVGGIIGTMGGEAVQQLAEHAMGSPAAPTTTEESARRIGGEALMQTAGEGAGRLAGKALAGRGLAPFAKSVTPEATEAMRFLEPYTKQGLLPAEASSSRVLDILQNISESSLLGGGAIKAFKEGRQEQVFDKIADEIVDAMGPRMTPDVAGRAVVESATRGLEVSTFPAKMIYQGIDRAAAPEYFDAIASMKVQRADAPVMKEMIAKMSVTPETETITKDAIKRMQVKDTTGPVKKTDKIIGFDDEGDTIVERVESGGNLQRLRVRTTQQQVPVGEELRKLNVKTSYQDVQVGERLERLKVMVTTQEQQISGPRIDLSGLKDDLSAAVQIAKQTKGLEDRAMGNTLVEFVNSKPDLVSYPVAKQLRTEIRVLSDALKNSPETKNAPAIGKATLIYGKLTGEIEKGLGEYDPFLAEQWKDANFIERAGQLQFNNKLIRSLVRKADELQAGQPEAIASQVFRNISTLRKVKNAVDGTTWDKVLSFKLQDLIAKASDGKPLDGKTLEGLMFGPTGVGQEAMVTAFGPERVAQYRQFINAMKVAQEKQTEGTGRILIQLAQGGAFLNLAANVTGLSDTGFEAESGLVILGPPVLAKLMTQPTTARLLIQGLKLPAGTPAAGALAGRLLSAAFPRPTVAEGPRPEPARPSSAPVRAFPLAQ